MKVKEILRVLNALDKSKDSKLDGMLTNCTVYELKSFLAEFDSDFEFVVESEGDYTLNDSLTYNKIFKF